MEVNATPVPTAITSVPALAASMRALDCTSFAEPLHDLHIHDPLVPMYEITGDSPQDEAASSVHTLEEISDRLRRLHTAYGEWSEFDAGAYFDLSPAQTRRLVRVSERVSTVHVTFFADLLLPTFRRAEAFWYDRFCPAYWQMIDGLRTARKPAQLVNTFTRQAQPEMLRLWAALNDVVRQAQTVMQESSAYLIAYLCHEERTRWRRAWQQEPVRGIDPQLQPDLRALPTLTLSTEFPLPTSRQPGRLRRLRNSRARGRPPQFLHWRALDG